MNSKTAGIVFFAVLGITSITAAQYLQIHQRYPLGSDPYSNTSADFDGDGFADLAIGHLTTEDIYLYRGEGDGSFNLLSIADGGQQTVENLYAADLDNDQDMDLMLGSWGEEFHLLFNNGDGTFAPPASISLASRPHSMTCADFDGDGNLDLAVAAWILAGYINLFLGNGDGSFQDPATIYDGLRVATITTDDFDQDGDLDLAFSSQYNIKTMLNNGDGTFAEPVTIDTVSDYDVRRMRTYDFNNDGSPDLLFSLNNTLSPNYLCTPYVSLNNGDGSFQPVTQAISGWRGCVDAIGGDFNRDGYVDICHISSEFDLNPWVIVNHNDGTGDFTDHEDTEVLFIPDISVDLRALACGDFDFDNDLDIAVVCDSLVILENTSSGPVNLMVTPTASTIIPSNGGTLTYSVHLQSNLGITVEGLRYWTMVTLPGGQDYGPLMQRPFTLTPYMDVTVSNMTQEVPGFAPAGTYIHTSYTGFINNPDLQISDSFDFTKEGAAGGEIVFDPAQWPATGTLIASDEGAEVLASAQFVLWEARPNPFNATTQLSVSLPGTSELNVAVYNVLGRQVAELENGIVQAGLHMYRFDGSGVASGVYFVRAIVPNQNQQVRKIVLMK